MSARKKQQTTPAPVVVSTICSVCGEDWQQHNADDNGEVSTLECVRLLKAKLAYRPNITYNYQWWHQPYRQQPIWWSTIQCNTGNASTAVSYNTPSLTAAASVT